MPNDDVSSQAKGLGTMLSFWDRMRNVCPKINSYSGPILNSNNQQCVTSRDLDEAMLGTRQFWFDPPIQDDHAWQPVLELYENTPRWPPIAPPGRDVCLSTLLHILKIRRLARMAFHTLPGVFFQKGRFRQ